MAAITTTLFGLLKAGDHCIVHSPIYGGAPLLPPARARSFGSRATQPHHGHRFSFSLSLSGRTPPGTHETFDLLTTYGVEVTRIPLPEDGSIDGYR
jgi:hypothetical protein